MLFIAHLSKLNLFDDNSSFFSRSSFNSFSNKQQLQQQQQIDGSSSDHSQAMSNAQLPDLLNGTLNNNNNSNSMGLDAKQLLKNLGSFGNEPHDDWESAFKYLMSKSSFNNNKHYEDQQQEEFLRFQEMRKHSNMSGLNQFNNMFNSEFFRLF